MTKMVDGLVITVVSDSEYVKHVYVLMKLPDNT